jgi:hypothetical protein
MGKQKIIRMNNDGPEGTGLEFWGHLESDKVLEGEPMKKDITILPMPQASLQRVCGK